MLKINKQDFRNIKILLKNRTITEKKFKNQIILDKLKNNGAIENGDRKAIVRWVNVKKEENIFLFLKNNDYYIDSMDMLDLYVEEMLDNKPTRDTIQKWHKDTKAKNSQSLKGLYFSSLNNIDIKLNDEIVTILPNNGLGYFLFHTEKVEVSTDTIIVGIENYQVVWFSKKYKEFFEGENILFTMITPYMLEWIEDLENEYIHFGDYDLAGINIYINKIIPRLKKSKKYSLLTPKNIEYLIQEYGISKLYENQKGLKNIIIEDEKIQDLQKIINDNKKGLEQEGLYLF